MTFRQMIDAVKTEHGFDVAEPTVKNWLNERYATMVVRARWRLASMQLGLTVAGQSTYAIDDSIQELVFVYIGALGLPYVYVSPVEMQTIQAGGARLVGNDAAGAFAPSFDQAGNAAIELDPPPATSADPITGFVALPPADLSGDLEVPKIPADFHKGIVDGTIAIGLERDAERLEEAKYFLASFDSATDGLRRRRNSRIGSGPTRIRLVR